jgi:hypothetical protein
MAGARCSAASTSPASTRAARAPAARADRRSDRARDKKEALPWRDTDLLVEGPVVAELQKLFFETWTAQKGPTPAPRRYFPALQPRGTEVVRALNSSPDDPFSQIYVTLISAINSAENEILLTNAYFVPDPQLMQALIDAVKRGVDVKLIVPSKTDSSLVFHAGRAHYEKLLEGGVKLYERRDALLHAKTVVIDGVWSTVGSTNLDWRSFLHNQELTAVILGTDFGSKMRDAFARDLAASDQVTLEAWRNRPVTTRYEGDVSLDSGSTGYEHPSALPRARGGVRRGRLSLSVSPAAVAQDAATLKARYASLQDKFASNQFGRPLVLESTQSSGDLKGDVYAIVEHPFSTVQQALVSPEHWCDILILHLNVKRCKASAGAPKTLSLNVGRKFDQPIEDAYELNFKYRVGASSADYLQVLLSADEGPLSTKNYRIQVEAVPSRRSAPSSTCRTRTANGFAAKMAMQTYLAHAWQRQGRLHDRRQEADGKPVYQAGCSASSSATRCATTSRSTPTCRRTGCPPPSSPKSASASGTPARSATRSSSTRWTRAEYLDMKRKEMRRQQES